MGKLWQKFKQFFKTEPEAKLKLEALPIYEREPTYHCKICGEPRFCSHHMKGRLEYLCVDCHKIAHKYEIKARIRQLERKKKKKREQFVFR